ncbi:hypothetical protein BLNAU_8305 [Blattamonas nauphoetae]|uniref:Uncharacterized protein n=1 Tax=Blattamonas nauphoetae TaxID=2049346 RepID=A0ABQ9XYV3_9EUKA|nr:hypothetical protein BLNAU_8305 [Blattamonas nauphoetae]
MLNHEKTMIPTNESHSSRQKVQQNRSSDIRNRQPLSSSVQAHPITTSTDIGHRTHLKNNHNTKTTKPTKKQQQSDRVLEDYHSTSDLERNILTPRTSTVVSPNEESNDTRTHSSGPRRESEDYEDVEGGMEAVEVSEWTSASEWSEVEAVKNKPVLSTQSTSKTRQTDLNRQYQTGRQEQTSFPVKPLTPPAPLTHHANIDPSVSPPSQTEFDSKLKRDRAARKEEKKSGKSRGDTDEWMEKMKHEMENVRRRQHEVEMGLKRNEAKERAGQDGTDARPDRAKKDTSDLSTVSHPTHPEIVRPSVERQGSEEENGGDWTEKEGDEEDPKIEYEEVEVECSSSEWETEEEEEEDQSAHQSSSLQPTTHATEREGKRGEEDRERDDQERVGGTISEGRRRHSNPLATPQTNLFDRLVGEMMESGRKSVRKDEKSDISERNETKEEMDRVGMDGEKPEEESQPQHRPLRQPLRKPNGQKEREKQEEQKRLAQTMPAASSMFPNPAPTHPAFYTSQHNARGRQENHEGIHAGLSTLGLSFRSSFSASVREDEESDSDGVASVTGVDGIIVTEQLTSALNRIRLLEQQNENEKKKQKLIREEEKEERDAMRQKLEEKEREKRRKQRKEFEKEKEQLREEWRRTREKERKEAEGKASALRGDVEAEKKKRKEVEQDLIEEREVRKRLEERLASAEIVNSEKMHEKMVEWEEEQEQIRKERAEEKEKMRQLEGELEEKRRLEKEVQALLRENEELKRKDKERRERLQKEEMLREEKDRQEARRKEKEKRKRAEERKREREETRLLLTLQQEADAMKKELDIQKREKELEMEEAARRDLQDKMLADEAKKKLEEEMKVEEKTELGGNVWKSDREKEEDLERKWMAEKRERDEKIRQILGTLEEEETEEKEEEEMTRGKEKKREAKKVKEERRGIKVKNEQPSEGFVVFRGSDLSDSSETDDSRPRHKKHREETRVGEKVGERKAAKTAPLTRIHQPVQASEWTPDERRRQPVADRRGEGRREEGRHRRKDGERRDVLENNFDLDEGAIIEWSHGQKVSREEENVISALSFPDSGSVFVDDQFHHFVLERSISLDIRKTRPLFCYAHFHRKEDNTNKRGFYQKSFVLITALPLHRMWYDVVRLLGSDFHKQRADLGDKYLNEFQRWPPPVEGTNYCVHILQKEINFSIASTKIIFLPGDMLNRHHAGTFSFVSTMDEFSGRKSISRLLPISGSPTRVPVAPPSVRDDYTPSGQLATSSTSLKHFVNLIPNRFLTNSAFYQTPSIFPTFPALSPILSSLSLIWQSLIINKPICFVCPSPTLCSFAVNAAMSLVSPLPLKQGIQPYFNLIGDGRRSGVSEQIPASSINSSVDQVQSEILEEDACGVGSPFSILSADSQRNRDSFSSVTGPMSPPTDHDSSFNHLRANPFLKSLGELSGSSPSFAHISHDGQTTSMARLHPTLDYQDPYFTDISRAIPMENSSTKTFLLKRIKRVTPTPSDFKAFPRPLEQNVYFEVILAKATPIDLPLRIPDFHPFLLPSGAVKRLDGEDSQETSPRLSPLAHRPTVFAVTHPLFLSLPTYSNTLFFNLSSSFTSASFLSSSPTAQSFLPLFHSFHLQQLPSVNLSALCDVQSWQALTHIPPFIKFPANQPQNTILPQKSDSPLPLLPLLRQQPMLLPALTEAIEKDSTIQALDIIIQNSFSSLTSLFLSPLDTFFFDHNTGLHPSLVLLRFILNSPSFHPFISFAHSPTTTCPTHLKREFLFYVANSPLLIPPDLAALSLSSSSLQTLYSHFFSSPSFTIWFEQRAKMVEAAIALFLERLRFDFSWQLPIDKTNDGQHSPSRLTTTSPQLNLWIQKLWPSWSLVSMAMYLKGRLRWEEEDLRREKELNSDTEQDSARYPSFPPQSHIERKETWERHLTTILDALPPSISGFLQNMKPEDFSVCF